MAKIPTTQVFQKGSVWMYSPALPPAIVFLILYFFAFVYITYLTFHRYKTWYLTVIPLGAFTEVAGYAVRIFSVKNQGNIGAFIVTLTLHVLAPLLFAAGNYILLGRLIAHVLPPSRQTLLRIPRRYITRIFVGFDILAAAIQGSGTSIAAAAKWTGLKALAGVDVLVAGLAVQVAGVGLFLVVLGRFEVLVKGVGKGMKRGSWEGLLVAVWISSVLIFIRCIYRLVEFVEGIDGYAFRSEWLFWVFEGTAMLVSILVFCVWHPGACLRGEVVELVKTADGGGGELKLGRV